VAQLSRDVYGFVRTCHLCQLRQTRNILIPDVATAYLRENVYGLDAYARQAGFITSHRAVSLTHYRVRLLRKETEKSLGDWIFEDILCRWGHSRDRFRQRGSYVKALDYLAKRYHIHHIRISGYNSRANGIVERHTSMSDSSIQSRRWRSGKWCWAAHSVFWPIALPLAVEWDVPRIRSHWHAPLLPFDITEATYLLPPPPRFFRPPIS